MVSIIVAVYNLERYIKRCLSTIKDQTYDDIEVLVINDGSTDNSLSVIQESIKGDKRFQIIDIPNGGVSNARNIGLQESRGEYIAFIDGDDIISKSYIYSLMAVMDEDVVLSMCNSESLQESQVFSEDRCLFSDEPKPNTMIEAKQCAEWLLGGQFATRVWGAIFRRQAIGDLRFNNELKNAEDKLFLFSFLVRNANKSVAYSKAKLYGYVVNRPTSATNRAWNGRTDAVIASDLMDNLVKTHFPSWKDVSDQNRIVSRLDILKSIIRANNKTMEAQEVFERIRTELKSISRPGCLSFRTKTELICLTIGRLAYKILIKLFYLIMNDAARNRTKEKRKIIICRQ